MLSFQPCFVAYVFRFIAPIYWSTHEVSQIRYIDLTEHFNSLSKRTTRNTYITLIRGGTLIISKFAYQLYVVSEFVSLGKCLHEWTRLSAKLHKW